MTRFLRRSISVLALLPLVAAAAGNATRELNDALRAKADPARGAQLYAQCVACHGLEGNGETTGATPRIAGQHYRVLVKQLVDFRHGKRWDFRMEAMADQHHLGDSQGIADVAIYITGLTRPGTRGVGSGEFADEGQQLYAARCQSCHGTAAQGDSSRGIPLLAGQHYGYLLRQMYDAVDGRRPALPRLHSARIAPLDFQQVRAVSDFLARIGWPAGKTTDALPPGPAPVQ